MKVTNSKLAVPKLFITLLMVKKCEPIEELTIEVGPEFVGAVSQELGIRKADLKKSRTH